MHKGTDMNIKSFLIGSAAALATVSGAAAADAVVAAEPEPMEYVRVCDAYGAGYFYIPGTETCMKIGGWVRYEIWGGSAALTGSLGTGFTKRARGRVEIEAKNESDLGTVFSYIRLDVGHWSDPDGVGPLTRAMTTNYQFSLGVGGLEMGYRDSQWNRFSGYGGMTEGESGGYYYGYQERHYISYTFTGQSFSAILSLDHDDDLNYLPDVMAGVSGKFGKVDATLSVGYDTSASAAAIKATLNAPVGPATLRLVGFYSTGANQYWTPVGGGSGWGLIAGVYVPVGEKAAVALDFTYDSSAFWDVTGDVRYTIAPGLATLLEVSHNSLGQTAGMLRFERSF